MSSLWRQVRNELSSKHKVIYRVQTITRIWTSFPSDSEYRIKKIISSLEPPYDRKDFRQPMQFQTPHFQTRMTTVLKISTRMIWAISYGQYRMSHRRYIEPLCNLNSLLDFEISLKWKNGVRKYKSILRRDNRQLRSLFWNNVEWLTSRWYYFGRLESAEIPSIWFKYIFLMGIFIK